MFDGTVVRQGASVVTIISTSQVPVLDLSKPNITLADAANFLRSGCPAVQLIFPADEENAWDTKCEQFFALVTQEKEERFVTTGPSHFEFGETLHYAMIVVRREALRVTPTRQTMLTMLDDLNLSTRTRNLLASEGLYVLGMVAERSTAHLLTIEGLGKGNIKEIEAVVREKLGVELGLALDEETRAWLVAQNRMRRPFWCRVGNPAEW